MSFDSQWTRHVGSVSATMELLCRELSPETVTAALEVEPTSTNLARATGSEKTGCMWCYDSASQFSSTDISEHIRQLLKIFLPIKSRFEELRPPPRVIVRMHWESTIADLAQPQIAADCVAGLAALGASLLINVVKIDEVPRA